MVDDAQAGWRISHTLEQLGRSVPGDVLHHHDDLLCTHGKFHRADDRRDRVRSVGDPVRQIAVGTHLEPAEDGVIEVAATHHRERYGVLGDGCAGQQRHGRAARIDQVPIDFVAHRGASAAEDAVFAVQDDFAVCRQIIRHHRRHPDAKVDVDAVGQIMRDQVGDLRAGQWLGLAHRAPPTATTALTKIPGVITCSGASSPSATTRSTCTMLWRAAMHITDPKARPA